MPKTTYAVWVLVEEFDPKTEKYTELSLEATDFASTATFFKLKDAMRLASTLHAVGSLTTLVDSARNVVKCWESGDLAAAVRLLAHEVRVIENHLSANGFPRERNTCHAKRKRKYSSSKAAMKTKRKSSRT